MSNTAHIACQQFSIQGAGETIRAVTERKDVFSPPHHGPRNIPITVHLCEGSAFSYTHFPIVRTGRYAIYVDTPGVFAGMVYGGTNQNTGTGTIIDFEPTSTGGCEAFAAGFVSAGEIIFTQDDPQPIALKFANGDHGGKSIRYIVSLFEG
ncbi:MAG: hypothetical protein AAF772_06690 [Acidobacteriota bacterium]